MSEPVSVTVDSVFELLDAALNDAIAKGGGKAKSVAWDVRGYFLKEIGSLRTLKARASALSEEGR